MSRTALALLVVALALPGCDQPAPPGPWQDADGYRWRELAPAGDRPPGFTELAPRTTGIAFRNDVPETLAFENRHLVQGSGVTIADVDGDGWNDIYLARIDGPNALYHNRGGWRFVDMAAEAGVALVERASTGAVFADVDGDGDPDLITTAMGDRNSLFLNDGTGHFRDATAESGFVPESRGSTSVAVADVDGDGDLDLYVVNYKARTMLDSLSPQVRAFDQLVRRVNGRFEIVPELADHYRVVVRDDIRGVSVVQRADPDWFYLNDGRGHFTREPLAGNPRFRDETGALLAREPDDFGLAARFFDANGDGAPDLYVANDFEDPDQFWLNDGRGGFRLVDRAAVRQTANSGMAVDVADVDRDGLPDLFETDMLANDRRRKTQIPTHTPLPKVSGDYHERSQWQRNVLLANRGDGSFGEVGMMAGIEASGWSWAALFLDVDLDGYEDVLVANGHRWDLMDADVQERLKSTMTGLSWREERKLFPRLALRNVAFRNRGGFAFEDASLAWGFGREEDISHAMAAGDLDGDGDADLVVTRLDAPVLLLRNNAPGGRIEVSLAGRPPNVDGVGAVVRVLAPDLPPQSREIAGGGLYLAGSAPAATFAMRADSATIEVRWRRGGISRVPALAGRGYEIVEPPEPAALDPVGDRVAPVWFADESARLDHRHTEAPFDDFERQGLLPNALSRFGPGVSWIDFDLDGDPDLVVGAGAGGRLGVLRNDRGRFTPLDAPSPVHFDLTAVVGAAGSLIVGQSSYEARSPDEALGAAAAFRLSIRGAGLSPAVPGDTTSAGPLALADIDGDGDLDLFVGGRVAPGVYPVPANSRILLADGFGFRPDDANAALLRGVGMVSGAVFTDLDGDGDPDLALALEWGPIRVLINERGRFRDATEAMGLAGLSGRWNGITAGDFDGDGRLDLVATNWGRNTGLRASPVTPLYLYFGDWAGTGAVAMSMAAPDSNVGGIAPLVTLSRLTAAVPGQRRRTPTFADYAGATIEKALGDGISRGGRLVATTLDHTVFLNRGDRFEARPLPAGAQVAPAFGVVVADFDGDGSEDLFLAQNFSATSIVTPRFDAGQGAVMRGDGAGAFALVPSRMAGIALAADQRGAATADFDGDGRADLVVGQNAAEARLFRNVAGRPGVLVRFADPGTAAGAVVRLEFSGRSGPVREVHFGAGFWSQDDTGLVLGHGDEEPRAVVVRWRDGATTRHPLSAGQRVVFVRRS